MVTVQTRGIHSEPCRTESPTGAFVSPRAAAPRRFFGRTRRIEGIRNIHKDDFNIEASRRSLRRSDKARLSSHFGLVFVTTPEIRYATAQHSSSLITLPVKRRD